MGLFDIFKKSSNSSDSKAISNPGQEQPKSNDLIANTEGMLAEVNVDLTKVDAVKLPIEQLATFGGGFASLLSSLQAVGSKASTAETLYRCVFPAGVTGQLQVANNDGRIIGSIMNNGKIVGQARWVPVNL